MSRVLVIPDIHLKPCMLCSASKIIEEVKPDYIAMLGDLVDDWGQESNIQLYNETFYAIKRLCCEHPNTFLCFGNHDVSYYWHALETGFSEAARMSVIAGLRDLEAVLPEGHCAFMHRIDNVIFSHAGLMRSFVERHFPNEAEREIQHIIQTVNNMGREELWMHDSPLWARPQRKEAIPYQMSGILQVVGHTPVETALYEDGVLTLDTFSTYRSGEPYGDRKWILIDCNACDYTEIQ